MTKKRSLLLCFFILFFVLSAIAHIPASTVLNSSFIPKQIRVQNANGSIWQASVEKMEITLQRHVVDLGKVNWTVHWMSLLTGTLNLDVWLGKGSDLGIVANGRIELTRHQLQLKDFTFGFPVERISHYFSSLVSTSAKGQGRIYIDHLAVQNNECVEAKGDIVWRHAEIRVFSNEIDLNSVQGSMGCENGAMSIQLRQQSQMLQSRAKILLSKKYISLDGKFQPDNSLPDTIKNWITNQPFDPESGNYLVHYQRRR